MQVSTDATSIRNATLFRTLRLMRKSLESRLTSESVEQRSYAYLAYLLTLRRIPPNVRLYQATRAQQAQGILAARGVRGLMGVGQACVDVWYVGTLSNGTNSALLRPEQHTLDELTHQLGAARNDPDPAAPVIYFVLASALQRLGVPGVRSPPWEWQQLADERRLATTQPVAYVYLLTHVYLYCTDFGMLRVSDVRGECEREVATAAELLLRHTRTMIEPTSRRVLVGGVTSAADLVGEMLVVLLRVYGRMHPITAMVARVVEEMLASDEVCVMAEAGNMRGHTQVVLLSSWAMWRGDGGVLATGFEGVDPLP